MEVIQPSILAVLKERHVLNMQDTAPQGLVLNITVLMDLGTLA